MFTFYCIIGPHLSALKLESEHLYNLVMHVPRPFFKLRHFVFVLQYNFNSDINDNIGLQSVNIVLNCFLERLWGC